MGGGGTSWIGGIRAGRRSVSHFLLLQVLSLILRKKLPVSDKEASCGEGTQTESCTLVEMWP